MLKIFSKKFNDAEIIAAIQGGTADMDRCVAQLYSANRKPIFSYVLKNSGSSEDAMEILQIGISRLYEIVLAGDFQSRSSLGSYLFAICRNTWINSRKKATRLEPLPMDESPERIAPDPLQYLETQELRSQISELLALIGDQCRKLLIWSDGERRPMKWITEELGYNSVQSTMNRKSKCKRALKEKVRETPRHREMLEEVLGRECLARLN